MGSTENDSRGSAAADVQVALTVARGADMPISKRSRAARLIELLISRGDATAREIAAAIVVTEPTIATYRAGRVKIPLERQLCLALFAIEHSPGTRRAGFALRAQVEAELAVASTRSETHNGPPATHRWP